MYKNTVHSKHVSNNLRRVMIILATEILLFVLPQSLAADELDYPCRPLIAAGAYGTAQTQLEQLTAQTPDDYTVYYACYKLFVTRANPKRDIKRAYENLCLSQDKLNAASAKERAKAEKNGYTHQLYSSEYANVTLLAQLEAQRKNSVEAWDYYLATYRRAPQKQLVQATKTRNTLAFRQAERANTVESYQAFITHYPDAPERPTAEIRMYTLAYNAIIDKGSEQECRQYVERYPGSPHRDKVRDRADELEMRRIVKRWDWLTQKTYLTDHTQPNRWRDTTLVYLMRYIHRTHAIEAARWGIMNTPRPYSDSCWLTLRDVCLEDTTLKPLVTFYNSYSSYAVPEQQKADKQLLDAHNDYLNGTITDEQYIDLVAPAYPAYYRLQGLIRADVKAKRWADALATVRAHSRAFGNDRRYLDLVRVLEEPEDPKMAPTSIGAGVNTPDGNEFAPVISADGKQLYFCGTKRPGNIGKEDIFFSSMTPKGWSKATPVTELNTADANEAPLSLTADGTTMIIFKSGKLMLSHRTKDGWGPLQPFSSTVNISEWTADAMITSDGKALLFAALSKASHEHQTSINIFVSFLRENGEWTKPFGLGPNINTTRIDRSPFLHPDMKTLYFCSEGHSSLGKMDVFVSTRLSERSWLEWSEPVNIGKSINTVGNECWYKISTDGSLAYFSKRENKQNDLCQLSIPQHFRPQPVTTISGTVTDIHGAPVVTMIRWEDLETQRLVGQTRTDPEDGSFFIVLPEGKNYGYYIYNEKLFPVADNIDLRETHEFLTVENNITVASIREMIETETPMPMNNLFFNTGEYELLPPSVAELNRVAAIIRQQGLPVEISGHTDNVGTDEYNRALSENRANAVRNYLIKLGVHKELLRTHGYGKSRPVASNNTAQGRQKNRRVEMKFIKK